MLRRLQSPFLVDSPQEYTSHSYTALEATSTVNQNVNDEENKQSIQTQICFP